MNIPATIENAFLLAYFLDDKAKVESIRRLQGHFLRAQKDYESSRITQEDLRATELGVLKQIHAMFSPQRSPR